MDFYEVLAQVIEILQREGRTSYRALKRQFDLDDDYLEDLKAELVQAKKLAIDEDGAVLVWIGELAPSEPVSQPDQPDSKPVVEPAQPIRGTSLLIESHTPEAERRQLTVMFCDLVDSTLLSSQLDPEELREVLRAYQEASARVIARFEGYIAQYLGDGLLVYFGYPMAHEDDAQRAVRTGLGIVEALGQLNTQLSSEHGVRLGVRLGIHTGIVVVGDVGGGSRQEQLALGETPNVAARLQGIAAPNTVVISAATKQLLGGFFDSKSLGIPLLKGLTQPIEVFEVHYERMARSRMEVVGHMGLTPLVGREQEIELLRERWRQVKDGVGQVVLLSGEAGIGKSRLVELLKEQVAAEPQAWLTPCQCSPYHQHSAWYPMIDLFERVVLGFEPRESPQQKLNKLEGLLAQYGMPLAETVPLLAALFSLPLTPEYAPASGSPEQQKQQTLQTFFTMLRRIAAQQPVLFVMEDLHWVDATTLEFLNLIIDQGPTARILALLTFRPDFTPPWTSRSHLSHLTLHRLTRSETAEIATRVAHGKTLPSEVIDQVAAKTDGVPLFVEELTKMVLESGLLLEQEDRYALTGPLPALAIPATLHDSLMARLDRLAAVKALAQLGATLGREFSYALLRAVFPWDEATLQQGLRQLVEAEFLYQRGLPPQATYVFKHALIQETAYQSLLRSTRQQHHQRIAQMVEAQFPEIASTQPERLAHHYTEAGLFVEAIPYWRHAGHQAAQRSAHVEARSHLTAALELLTALPDFPEQIEQELELQTALGLSLLATRGFGAQEVEHVYARARELCQQMGDTAQLFPVLWGLWWFYETRAELCTAKEMAEQLLTISQRDHEAALLLQARRAMGQTLYWCGEFRQAHTHFEQGIALYSPQPHHASAFVYGQDPGVGLRNFSTLVLWHLGYPEQAVGCIRESLALAHEVNHPFSVAFALSFMTWLHHYRRDAPATQIQAEIAMTLCREQGFDFFLSQQTILWGWALAEQGQTEQGIAQMHQGIASYQATGAMGETPYLRGLLAESYGKAGQAQEGLLILEEALAAVQKHELLVYEGELSRLKGELVLMQLEMLVGERQTSVTESVAAETEAYFRHALNLAQRQQAKSLELRAATSLARLWQSQGKRQEAYDLLAPVYGWFTEGFDTADLIDAKALLTELAQGE